MHERNLAFTARGAISSAFRKRSDFAGSLWPIKPSSERGVEKSGVLSSKS